ncbi:hypothetical protein BASA81_008676 [Batrachochytrium salamandrivorans]|nr:hypothetical protein BASA81_008676 [Batrachochytrium salamandrivorans]
MWLVLVAILLLAPGVCRGNWTKLYQHTPSGARYGSRAVHCERADVMILVDDLCDAIFQFNFSTSSWSTVDLIQNSTKPSTRSFFTFTKVSETADTCTVIMTSGKRVVPVNLNNAFVLVVRPQTSTARWFLVEITSPTRPAVRISSNAVSMRENSIHMFGGSMQSTMSYNDFWELQLTRVVVTGTGNETYSGSWTEITRQDGAAAWPLARHAHAMTMLDSNGIVVHGGRRYITSSEMISLGLDLNYVFLEEMAVYNTLTGVWKIISNTNKIQRSSHAMFSWDHRVFAFGGYRRGKTSTFQTNDVLMSSPYPQLDLPCFNSSSTGTWCNTTDETEELPAARFEFASVWRNGTFVVCGGLSLTIGGEQIMLQDIWVFSMRNAYATGVAVPRPDTVDTQDGSAHSSSMYYMLAALVLILLGGMLLVFRLKRRYQTAPSPDPNVDAHAVLQFAQDPQGPVGASEADIKALPVRRYIKPSSLPATAAAASVEDVESQGTRETGDDACAICLGDYETGEDLRELPCVHYFHTQCVDEWLGRNDVCPMCKQKIGRAVAAVEDDSNSEEEQAHHGHSHNGQEECHEHHQRPSDGEPSTLANV